VPAREHGRRAARAGAGLAAATLAAWTVWGEPRRLVVRRDSLALPHWPQALEGLRVGVISDVHAGMPHMGLREIARAVDRLAAEAPDLILALGDYVEAGTLFGGRLAPERVAAQLGRLDAPLGTFAVLGNHDWKQVNDRMRVALERAGIRVLENQAAPVPAGDDGATRLWIAGLADVRCRRANPEGAVARVPDGEPILLLSHDPDAFPHVPERVCLTLAGHLHGGQVAIPLVRRLMIPSWYGERYVGHHVVEGGRHLYVSSGLGTSGVPVRLLAPPEVVVLELRSDGGAPLSRPARPPAPGSAA
jgi:predicted MPP superfamily phosphohydrolase